MDRKERFGRKCIIGSRRYTDGRGMIYFLLFLCEDGKERPLGGQLRLRLEVECEGRKSVGNS